MEYAQRLYHQHLYESREHLARNKISYLEHMHRALKMGFQMLKGGSALIIHSVVPSLFPSTGSDIVRELYFESVLKMERSEDTSEHEDASEHESRDEHEKEE